MFGSINLKAFQYSPNEMLADFKAIKFQVGGESVSIAVNKYRNNDHKNYPSAAKHGTQDALDVKNALLSLDNPAILARAGGASEYVGVFVGKGTPEGITKVLTMFHDYADKFVARYGKGGGPRRKCADWLADPHLSWQDTLQNISNEFIGLDCNGFVGNWLKRADPALRMHANTPIPFYLQKRKTPRKKVDDVLIGDVIVWTHNGHIAVIDDQPGPTSDKFIICQSAGGGPRRNEYSIRVSSPGRFLLSGGYPAGDVPGEVRIFSLWI